MARKRLRTKKMDDADLLSNLPRNVLDTILMCLPIRDVVRTSILSSEWRYTWVTIPSLNFDENCCLLSTDDLANTELVSIVDQVLLLHSGPIARFRFCHYLDSSSSHVDRWILFLSRNGIMEIILKFRKDEEDPYKVPSCLFSCKELKLLELHHCILKIPPTFKGFSYLKTLNLEDIDLTDGMIEDLVSKCSLLERLILVYASFLKKITIHAPRLVYLYLSGTFEDISFGNNSPLVEVNILYYPTGVTKKDAHRETSNLERVLGCLNKIEKLYVDDSFLPFLAIGNIPERLHDTFDNLEYLHLNLNFQEAKEISTALCMFRSSPYLQEIEIYTDLIKENAIIPEECFWEAQKNLDCVLLRLQIIKMTSMKGETHELEFIKFVLANAPVLQTMKIEIDPKKKSEELRIFKTLLQFQRASVEAKIVHLDV